MPTLRGTPAPADELPIEDMKGRTARRYPTRCGLTCSNTEVSTPLATGSAEGERFPGAAASAGPPYADSTFQRQGMERGFLGV